MLSRRTQYDGTEDLLEMIKTHLAKADEAACQEERPQSAGTMWVDFDGSGEPIVRYRNSQEDYKDGEQDPAHNLKSDSEQAMPFYFYDQGHIQPLKIPPRPRKRDRPRVCAGTQRTLQRPHHARNPLGTQAHTEHHIPRNRAAEPYIPFLPQGNEPFKKKKRMGRFSHFISRSRTRLREAIILRCFTIEQPDFIPATTVTSAQYAHDHYHVTRPERSQKAEQTTPYARTRQSIYAGDKSPHLLPQQHDERDQGCVPHPEDETCSGAYGAIPVMQRDPRHDQHDVSFPAPQCQDLLSVHQFQRKHAPLAQQVPQRSFNIPRKPLPQRTFNTAKASTSDCSAGKTCDVTKAILVTERQMHY